MKRKNRLAMAVITLCSLLIVIVIVSFVTAYLMDHEKADNVFVVGNVDVVLTEPEYPVDPDSHVIVPFSSIPKNPIVTNVGTNDAFVFIKLTVPKEEIEPVNDDGSLKYPETVTFTDGKRSSHKELSEIFMIKSNDPVSARTELTAPSGIDTGLTQLYNSSWYLLSNIDYNKNWYLIEKKETDKANTYVFAYNKALPSENNAALQTDTQSEAIFDSVKLAYFVEDEEMYKSPDTISVNAYAIQADNLLDSGDLVTSELNKDSPEVWQLKRIYEYFSKQTGV